MANVIQGIAKVAGAGLKGAIKGGASAGGISSTPFKVAQAGMGVVNSARQIYSRKKRLEAKASKPKRVRKKASVAQPNIK